MIREIKFRAWINNRSIVDVKQMNWHDDKIEEIGYASAIIKHKGFVETNYLYTGEFILMQYTGLKDKNGKEIYEGDIVKCDASISGKNKISRFTGVVEWDWHHYTINVFLNGEKWATNKLSLNNLEIIGNIYEHPHLLKQIT